MERQRLFILLSVVGLAAVGAVLFLFQDLEEPRDIGPDPDIPSTVGQPCKGRAVEIDETICIDGEVRLLD